MKLSFLGASGCVTGSSYLVETSRARILVDCGMFQERDIQHRNWEPFSYDPQSLTAVLLTHAHLDHCGLLPKLVRDGFRGRIYTTAASAEIAEVVMEDSGHIQEEDAKRKQRRHQKEGRRGSHPELPLYTAQDARNVIPHFRAVAVREAVEVGPGLTARWSLAGHILGACSIQLTEDRSPTPRRVLFSGDLGRWDRPLLEDPDPAPGADILLTEATYGDRLHGDPADLHGQFTEVVTDTLRRGGNLVIPSFAVERTHEVLYLINELRLAGKIPGGTIYLDSPSAADVTTIFKRHAAEFDLAARQLIGAGHSPFSQPGLVITRSPDESRLINDVKGAIIIAGSGMCTGGRIKHHLIHNIGRKESTILFVGYQSAGTLGRQITDGAREVRIFNETFTVGARIAKLEGFSGHGDAEELLRWADSIPGAPARVFVTHAEPQAAKSYAKTLFDRKQWTAEVPAYRDRVEF